MILLKKKIENIVKQIGEYYKLISEFRTINNYVFNQMYQIYVLGNDDNIKLHHNFLSANIVANQILKYMDYGNAEEICNYIFNRYNLLQMIKYIPKSTYLDVCCGIDSLKYFIPHSSTYIGVDNKSVFEDGKHVKIKDALEEIYLNPYDVYILHGALNYLFKHIEDSTSLIKYLISCNPKQIVIMTRKFNLNYSELLNIPNYICEFKECEKQFCADRKENKKIQLNIIREDCFKYSSLINHINWKEFLHLNV